MLGGHSTYYTFHNVHILLVTHFNRSVTKLRLLTNATRISRVLNSDDPG